MTLYVSDFRKMYTNADDRNKPLRLRTSDVTQKDTPSIYIKKYLPLEEKMRLVSSICSGCNYRRGVLFRILRVYYIAKHYLDDVNFPQKEIKQEVIDDNGEQKEVTKRIDDINQIVDILMGSKIWETINTHAGEDIKIIDQWVEEEMEEKRHANNLATQLEVLVAHIDDLVTDAIDGGFTEKMLQEAQKLTKALSDPKKSKAAKNIIEMIDKERKKND